jgi:phosphoserine phosphatase RsbU/P
VRTERAWLLLALAMNLVVVALELVGRSDATLIGFLIVGPLLASARLDGARTGLVAMFSLIIAIVIGIPEGIAGTREHVLQCLVVSTGGGFAAFSAHMRSEREGALLRMTKVAEVAQRALLRPIPGRIGGVAFATRYQSAGEEALMGGDLYDSALTPFGLRIIVGDVKGKGLDGVQLAAAVLGYFRQAAFAEPDLAWVAARLDAQLAAQLGIEDFVTVVLAEFRPGEVLLVNCGHHPPIRVGTERLEMLHPADSTPPLGLQPQPTVQAVELQPSERLLFYTDGLVEARDPQGNLFPIDARVRECLADPSLEDALDTLLGLVLAHTGGELDDDLALVLSETSAEGALLGVRANPNVATLAEDRPPG